MDTMQCALSIIQFSDIDILSVYGLLEITCVHFWMRFKTLHTMSIFVKSQGRLKKVQDSAVAEMITAVHVVVNISL